MTRSWNERKIWVFCFARLSKSRPLRLLRVSQPISVGSSNQRYQQIALIVAVCFHVSILEFDAVWGILAICTLHASPRDKDTHGEPRPTAPSSLSEDTHHNAWVAHINAVKIQKKLWPSEQYWPRYRRRCVQGAFSSHEFRWYLDTSRRREVNLKDWG